MATPDRAGEAAEIDLDTVMPPQAAVGLDLSDAMQLRAVIKVCCASRSLSDAGRKLYAYSATPNPSPTTPIA